MKPKLKNFMVQITYKWIATLYKNPSIIVSVTVSLAHALVQFTSLALLNKTSGEVGSRYSQEQLRTG